MASLSGALDQIRDRLVTHTPARDPQARYCHQPRPTDSRIDRTFRLVPPIGVTGNPITTPDPLGATLGVDVYYRARPETHDLLKDAGDDLEDLWQRLSYFCGQEWADGYTFMINGARIVEDGDGLILRLAIEASWNMME